MHLERWLIWALSLLALSLAMFAVSSDVEGPILVQISRGHAVAALDAAAILPLLAASALFYRGLWRARSRLSAAIGARPGWAVSTSLVAGFGLGMLLTSVFPFFAAWWSIGAFLFAIVTVGVCVAVGRS